MFSKITVLEALLKIGFQLPAERLLAAAHLPQAEMCFTFTSKGEAHPTPYGFSGSHLFSKLQNKVNPLAIC